MKNILTLVLFLLASMAFAVINNPGAGTAVDNTGTVKVYDGMWTTVKNDTGSTIAANSVVKYGPSGTSGYNVVLADTVGEHPACVVETAIPTGKSGTCKIYGRSTVLFELNQLETAVINESVYVSGITDGYASAAPTADVTASGVYRPIGQALTTCNATGTCEIFINVN